MDNGQLGRHVTAFFKNELQLHITTTTIRAIVETAAEDALRKGVIDGTKRAAISNVNGHSGATTQRHYVMQSRINDVENGRAGIETFQHESWILTFDRWAGFDAMFDRPIQPLDITPSSSTSNDDDIGGFEQNDQFDDCDLETDSDFSPIFSRNISGSWSENTSHLSRKINFGSAHPNYGQPNWKRAKWTDAELDVIMKWQCEHPTEKKNAIAKCLAAIRLDATLHPVFHVRHVCDSARLKDGFDALKRREGESTQVKLLKSLQKEMRRQKGLEGVSV
jgi:hypothetical protein